MDPQKLPQDNHSTNGQPQVPGPPPLDVNDLGLADVSDDKPQQTVVRPGQPSAFEPPRPQPDTPQPQMPPLQEEPLPIPPPAPPKPMPKKKKMGFLALIIIGAVLVLGLASAAAYFGYYLPKQPDNVLKSALVNSFSKDKVTSIKFEGSVKSEEKSSGQEVGGDFSGAVSKEGQFELTMNLDAIVTTLTLDMRSVDGKSLFVRVGGLEGLPELLALDPSTEAYAPILTSINNQWYEINESLIKQYTDNVLKAGTLTDEDLKKVAEAYSQHPFFTVSDTLPDETIKGTDSYHYKVVVDRDKLEAFAKALKDADLSGLELTQKNLDDFSNMLSGIDFSKYPVEVWIAKDSKLFTQFAFTQEDDTAKTTVRLTISAYNEEVKVEEPEGAKSVLEILTDIYSATGGLEMQTMVPGFELEGESSGDASISL